MDYETVVECYIELKRAGHYREDAGYLLLSEIEASSLLNTAEKNQLIIALDEILKNKAFGDSPAVNTIWTILEKHDRFTEEFASVGTTILQGYRSLDLL